MGAGEPGHQDSLEDVSGKKKRDPPEDPQRREHMDRRVLLPSLAGGETMPLGIGRYKPGGFEAYLRPAPTL